MSVVAIKDILPGEEIRVSYNYEIPKAPQWYQVKPSTLKPNLVLIWT